MPTYQNLYHYLAAGQDVEILVGIYKSVSTPTGSQFQRVSGHYLTVTGEQFGIPFAPGNGQIEVVDPAGGIDKTVGLLPFGPVLASVDYDAGIVHLR